MKVAITALALGLFAITAQADADATYKGHCQIVVKGKTYRNGPCTISVYETVTTVGAEKNLTLPWAYIFHTEPDSQQSWSGPTGGRRAHDDLGVLKKQRNCWVGNATKVCWRR